MKKTLSLLLLSVICHLPSAFGQLATPIQYNAKAMLFQMFGTTNAQNYIAATNPFTLTPYPFNAGNIVVNGGSFQYALPTTFSPDTNGNAFISAAPNSYLLNIQGINQGVEIAVPPTTNLQQMASLVIAGAGTYLYTNPNTNFYVAIDTNDLTPGLLAGKLAAGPGISLAVTNSGGNEQLVVSNAGVIQLLPGSGISLSPPNGQGVVTLNNTVSFSGTIISAACYSYTNVTTNSVSWPTNSIPFINNGSTIYQAYLSQYNFGGNSPCDIEAIVQVSAAQSLITHWIGGDLSGPGPDGVDGFALTTNILSSTNYFVAILLHQDLHLDEHDYYLLNTTAIPTNATLCVLDDSGFGFSTNLVNTNLIKPFNMTTFLQGLIETNIVE